MIEAWVVAFALILTRVGAFVGTLPLFDKQNVPGLVKVGLTVALASLWFGSFGPAAMAQFAQQPMGSPWLIYGLALGKEALLGAVLGYVFGLFLAPVRIAGEFIGQEMGLALAPMVDPTSANPSAVVTQIFEMLGVLILFELNVHHVFLAAMHASFAQWPIGGQWGAPPLAYLVGGVGAVQEWGLLLAAPIAVCLFIMSVFLAVLARTTPQLNNMTVGSSLRIGAGLLATIVLLPGLGAATVTIFGRLGDFIYRLI